MRKIAAFFGYSRALPTKKRYAYVVGLVSLIFITIYFVFYLIFVRSALVLSVSAFCILEYIASFFILRARKYYFANNLFVIALLLQVSLLVFIVFPISANINYFYFLIAPISFLIFDMGVKWEKISIIFYNTLALMLLALSELLPLEVGLIQIPQTSLRYFSIFSAVANIISIFIVYRSYAADLSRTHRDLHILASTDSLTNIANRRVLFEKGNELFLACAGLHHCFSLILLDIDHFKNINDQYGHPAGDAVLVQVTDLIKAHIRRNDIFARYGGEEFALICRNADLDDSMTIANHIKKLIQKSRFQTPNNGTVSLTISMGVVSFNSRHESFDAMVQQADKALYHAKQSGRNKVVSAPDPV